MATPELRLKQAWSAPPGIGGALTAVNHKTLGRRFMVTALVFFLLGGLEALAMRLQLALPGLQVLGPEKYNQVFTMHGSTMMFLFVIPFLEGLSMYVVPLMIGTRDMAFPRLNALGYWLYLFAGIALHVAFLAGAAPNSGWFNYVPLSGPGFNPGSNVDWWVTMITLLEVAALVAAVELIVTIFRMRAPGMTLARMPLFVWSSLVMAFMIVFAMPPLMAASMMLGLDRVAGTHFFNAAAGGDPLLWQHLFWFFGHPDVYIMLVPALGIVATIIPVSARRPTVGYSWIALSLVAIGFISFGLWVHHMYAAGLPVMGMNFFTAASMMITVPTGIILFAWLITLWRGRVRMNVPLLFCLGFFVLFILGGITGVMVASVSFDLQVHDTYFIVAHFHYVLLGGVVYPIFAAIYWWFPKMWGPQLGERLGRWHFWLFTVGFNVTFFPMHLLGFQGMPRRVYTYLPELEWSPLNLLATGGVFFMAAGLLVFLVNVALSLARRPHAGDNPWGAESLEWACPSPPPLYNFRFVPVVEGRHPLWEAPHPVTGAVAESHPWRESMADVRKGQRETLVTSSLDALPMHRILLPGPTPWPLWTAAGITIAALSAVLHPVPMLLGVVLTAVGLVGWHWPRENASPS